MLKELVTTEIEYWNMTLSELNKRLGGTLTMAIRDFELNNFTFKYKCG